MKSKIMVTAIILIFLFTACRAEDSASIKTMIATPELTTVAEEVDIVEEVHILGSFTTHFKLYPKSRAINIGLASDKINDVIVYPEEVFSFNETVGPANKENGYQIAKIFVKGKEKDGYGGGICQVSSTLFNTAQAANMEILERHPHTKKVHYVPEGCDAATSYGYKDFKFKNIYDFPIRIVSIVEEGSITIAITAI